MDSVRQSMSDIGKSIKSNTSGIIPEFGNEEEPSFTDQACACLPTLTYTQRLYGFIGCFAIGQFISFIGTLTIIGGKYKAFAALYSVGNFLSILSTGFLTGPKAQCKKMFDPTRRVASIAYIVLLITVFSLGITGQNIVLVLFFLVLQILAGIWYTLSYIPYGRKTATSCLGNSCCAPCKPCLDQMA